MKRFFPIIPIALIAAFASSGDLAYLSPDEVFTDLEIPEVNPEEEAPAEEQPAVQEQNPFENEVPAASPEPEPAVTEETTEEQAAPKPLFFRSGEEIPTVTEPAPPARQESDNIFEEPVEAAPEEAPARASRCTEELAIHSLESPRDHARR